MNNFNKISAFHCNEIKELCTKWTNKKIAESYKIFTGLYYGVNLKVSQILVLILNLDLDFLLDFDEELYDLFFENNCSFSNFLIIK